MYYYVIIKIGKSRAVRRFRDNRDLAKRFFKLAKEKYGEGKVFAATTIPKPRPAGLSPAAKWCPYCSQIRPFQLDRSVGIKRCVVCHASIKDFYVGTYNWFPELWSAPSRKRGTGRKVKRVVLDEEGKKQAKRDRAKRRRELRRAEAQTVHSRRRLR